MVEKRLRMFAGPNGSGKSTVFQFIQKKFRFDVGTYVNADDIEQEFKLNNKLVLEKYNINKNSITSIGFQKYLNSHSLFKKATKDGFIIDFELDNGIIKTPNNKTHSYEASILADFIRNSLVNNGKKLTFETVMSHKSKIETLKKSQELGYKNYLYFISTESVKINKQRVIERVLKGGHPVPENKIEGRYYKSLELLLDAIKYTHRTYIFDNSGKTSNLILDVHNGSTVTIHKEVIPKWVETYILKTAHNNLYS